MLREEIAEAYELAKLGYSNQQIADYFAPLTVDSLIEYCDESELKRLKIRRTRIIAEAAWEKAESGDPGMLRFMATEHLGWGRTKGVELTGKNGDPLEHKLSFDKESILEIGKILSDEY